jgi:hypothetical protein
LVCLRVFPKLTGPSFSSVGLQKKPQKQTKKVFVKNRKRKKKENCNHFQSGTIAS